MLHRHVAFVLIAAACGSSKSSTEPSPGSAAAPVAVKPPVDLAAVNAEVKQLGEQWRKDPKTTAPLQKLVELAHANSAWREAVPYIAESFKTTDVALDAAFTAAAELGPTEPALMVTVLTPIVTAEARDPVIDYKKVGAAQKRSGAAMIPAYLTAAKLVDQPAVRNFAIGELGRLGATQARPLLFAVLKEKPIVVRDSRGGFTDPRSRMQWSAVWALRTLGYDGASAGAALEFAFTQKEAWDGDRTTAIEAFAKITPAPSPAQMAQLLDHALHYKDNDDAEASAQAYVMLAATTAEVDALTAAPKSTWVHDPDYTALIAAGHRELACEHKPACLLLLVETLSTRQTDSAMIEKALHELARHPEPTLRGPLLELVDATDNRDSATTLFDWLPDLVVGPCPECIPHIEALVKRHETDSSWSYFYAGDKAIERLRARGGTAPAATPARVDSFIALLAAERAALGGPTRGKVDKVLFSPTAFGFGVDAAEVGVGPDALVGFAAKDLAGATEYQGIVKARRGLRGTAMWDAEIVIYNGSYAMFTQLAVMDGGVPKVRAWNWSHAVTDGDAVAAAKAKKLPQPAAVTDVHGDAELEAVARAAFGSREVWIKTLSARDDAFSFGNYLDDEWEGPKQGVAFQGMGATFTLRDGLHVEKVTADVGFAAGNVDFKGKSGTRTFRVLAVFAKDPDGWKIVQSQWSYGLPIPNVN